MMNRLLIALLLFACCIADANAARWRLGWRLRRSRPAATVTAIQQSTCVNGQCTIPAQLLQQPVRTVTPAPVAKPPTWMGAAPMRSYRCLAAPCRQQ